MSATMNEPRKKKPAKGGGKKKPQVNFTLDETQFGALLSYRNKVGVTLTHTDVAREIVVRFLLDNGFLNQTK